MKMTRLLTIYLDPKCAIMVRGDFNDTNNISFLGTTSYTIILRLTSKWLGGHCKMYKDQLFDMGCGIVNLGISMWFGRR